MFQYIITHSPLFYFIQSLWRDEAFSILAAERSFGFIITKLGFEPPLYYSLLHVWMKIFGESEIATRSLSLLGFTLATVIVLEWAHVLFKKHWLALFLPLSFFLNPMLLYYAFEVRTYGWYIFFSVATLYAYTNKKWLWFILSSVGGFYTHVYIGFLLASIGIHFLITEVLTKKLSVKKLLHHPVIQSFMIITLAVMPWIIRIILLSKQLANSWYYPVDFQLVLSVLGNMFVGYEGTPWFGWQYTKYLSFILIGLFAFSMHTPKTRSRNGLFLSVILLPLILVIGVSFFKPLFVNRYLIFVTIAEVFLIAFSLQSISKAWIQKIAALTVFIFLIWFNAWYPTQHAKLAIRPVIQEINALITPSDVIYAADPIIYMETMYYAAFRDRVFLYNPSNNAFPWYIGDAVVSSENMKTELPIYPKRAFMVYRDGSYTISYQSPLIKK